MSVPGGGDGPTLNYGVEFDTSGVEQATRRIEQLVKQLNDRLSRDLVATSRVIDSRATEQEAQRVVQVAQRTAQQMQQAFAQSTQGLNAAFQQSAQVASREATNISNSFGRAATESARAWEVAYGQAFNRIQQQQNVIRNSGLNPGLFQAPPGGGAGIRLPGAPDPGQESKQEQALHEFLAGAVRGVTRGFGGGAGVPIGVGLTTTAAGAILIANAVEAMTRAMNDAIVSGFKFNAQLEQSRLIFNQLTGDVNTSNQALQELRKYADVTPFNTQEVIKSGQAFLRVTQGNTQAMLEFVKAAGALATTNPEQGLGGATYAIRELLGGDVQSIADRFNISRRAIRAMMDEGLSGIQLIQRINQELGVSAKTVEEQSKTFSGRLSTVISFAQNLGQAFTFPAFEAMSAKLAGFTDSITQNQQAWMELAQAIGNAVNEGGRFLAFLGKIGGSLPGAKGVQGAAEFLGSQIEARQQEINRNRPPEQVQALTELQQLKPQIEAAQSEILKFGGAIDGTKAKIAANTAELSRLKAQASEITHEYERQIAPLQRQLELLNRPNYQREFAQAGLQRQSAQLDLARLDARPPVQVEAQAAADKVRLDVASRLAQIQARRIEIEQDAINASERGKSALEAQADAADKLVKTIQREVQAANEARQVRIQALREEQELGQRVRQDRLEALREEVRVAQQTRGDALDSLREQIRNTQDLRSESRETARDIREAYDDAYQAAERASDRAHKAQMDKFDQQAERLRSQLRDLERASKIPTAAERELQALDKTEREHDRQQALLDARRRVAQAKTGTDRVEAIRDLTELRHEQAVDIKREQLQAKIKAEQEAEDKKKVALQERIDAIQEKSRRADRQYQQEKEQREIAREAEIQQRRAQDRVEEAQDKATRRAEEAQIRAEEKADRLARREEENTIREQERTDRIAQRQEQDAIRAQEKIDREQDRIERQRIQEAQVAAEQAREAATLEREQREEARQIAADARKAAINAVELQQLNLEEGLLKAQDTNRIAELEASRVYVERAQARLEAEGKIEEATKRQLSIGLQERIDNLKDTEYTRLEFIQRQTKEYEVQRDILQGQLDTQQAQLAQMKEDLKELETRATKLRNIADGKNKPENGSPIGVPGTGQTATGAEIAQSLIDAVNQTFNNDETTKASVEGWAETDIKDAAESKLGISSPSTVFIDMAQNCIDSFVGRIQELAGLPGQAIAATFDGISELAGEKIGGIVETVVGVWGELPTRISETAQGVIDSIWAPFQSIIDQYLPGLPGAFGTAGTNSVTEWINGWLTKNPVQVIADTFSDLGSGFFTRLNEFFRGSGESAGVSWMNGWVSAFNENWGRIQNGIQSAVQNVQRFVSSASNTQQTRVGQTTTFVPTQESPYYDPNGIQPGESASEYRQRILGGIPGYDRGGSFQANQLYRIHEGEYVSMFSNKGSVYNQSQMDQLIRDSVGGGRGGTSVTLASGALQLTLNGTSDTDLDEFGHKLIRTIIAAVDSAEKYAPEPAKDTLGGAT